MAPTILTRPCDLCGYWERLWDCIVFGKELSLCHWCQRKIRAALEGK